MKVADLFVELGVKGADKTKKSLGVVTKGIGGIATGAVAATASIVGMMYAFQRITSSSNQLGTSLQQFGTLTGLDTESIQRYQYAGRQVRATNEGVLNSFKNLQAKMVDYVSGKGAPEGLGLLSSYVDMSSTAVDDVEGIFKKLQEFAVLNKNNPAMVRDALSSFGITDDVQAAMFKGGFNDKVMSRAPIISENQQKALENMDRRWENLGSKIERMFRNLNLKFGSQIIGNIENLLPAVEGLVSAFLNLAKKIELMKGAGKVFKGWEDIFKRITNDIDGIEKKGFWKHFMDSQKGFASDMGAVGSHWMRGLKSKYPPKENFTQSQNNGNFQIEQIFNFMNPGDNNAPEIGRRAREGTIDGITSLQDTYATTPTRNQGN